MERPRNPAPRVANSASNSRSTPGSTARPKRLQDARTLATVTATTAAPGLPQWATPLLRFLPSAPAQPQQEQAGRVPPLRIAAARPNPSHATRPGPQPRHVSDSNLHQDNNRRHPQAQTSRSSDPGEYPPARASQDRARPMVDPPSDADQLDFGTDPWEEMNGDGGTNHERRQTRIRFGDAVDEEREEEEDGRDDAAEGVGGGDMDGGDDDEEEDRADEDEDAEKDGDDEDDEDEEDKDEEDEDDEDDENGDGEPGDDQQSRQHRKRGKGAREAVVKKASAFGPSAAQAIQMVCRYVRSAAITKSPMASIEEEGKLIREAWPVVMQLKPFRDQNLPWKELYYPTVS